MPKLQNTPVFTNCLKPEQVLWHYKRSLAGGRSYIAGYVEDKDIFYIIPGKYAREFNSMSRPQLDELTIELEEMWKPSSTGS